MDRLIEIFRRVAFVTIWIIGGGFAVMFVLLSFHADTFLRQVMINFLRRMTGMIKMVGSWMMIMAGIGLTIYLTQPELVSGLFA